MDNSYVSVNVDMSPDVVNALVVAMLVSAGIFITHRVVKYLERLSAPQAA